MDSGVAFRAGSALEGLLKFLGFSSIYISNEQPYSISLRTSFADEKYSLSLFMFINRELIRKGVRGVRFSWSIQSESEMSLHKYSLKISRIPANPATYDEAITEALRVLPEIIGEYTRERVRVVR